MRNHITHIVTMPLYTWLLAALLFFSALPVQADLSVRKLAEDAPKAKKAADDKGKAEAEDEEKKKEPKEPDRYFAVVGGTVHTVTRGELEGMTILAKNGKIVEIGRGITLPKDTQVLEAKGFHVYPGLVAVNSGGLLSSSSPDDATDVYSLSMTLGLAAGVTTAVAGNNAAKLTFGTTKDIVVKRDLFVTIRYFSSDPKSRHDLRKKFEKVKQYMRDLAAYEESKKTDPDAEEPDSDWLKGDYEKYHKLMLHETVAAATADSANDILALCDLAKQYGIKIVVRGAAEGWTVASQMARAGLSATIIPRRRMGRDRRLNRPNGSSIENAAILYEHGVSFAIIPGQTSITLWGVAGRDLLHLNMEAGFAVRGGLSNEAAIKAITIEAARLLGVDQRVGSIEVGKDADFAITDGHLLHYLTHTRWTVVNGRIAYDKLKETLFSHIRPNGTLDSPKPKDLWPRVLGADQ